MLLSIFIYLLSIKRRSRLLVSGICQLVVTAVRFLLLHNITIRVICYIDSQCMVLVGGNKFQNILCEMSVFELVQWRTLQAAPVPMNLIYHCIIISFRTLIHVIFIFTSNEISHVDFGHLLPGFNSAPHYFKIFISFQFLFEF